MSVINDIFEVWDDDAWEEDTWGELEAGSGDSALLNQLYYRIRRLLR